MKELSRRFRIGPIVAWLAAVVGSGLAGFVAIALRYTEFLDCSNPEIHESANTPFGWTIAVLTTGLPLVIVGSMRRSSPRWLLPAAVGVALLELVVWIWLLNPARCEWQ